MDMKTIRAIRCVFSARLTQFHTILAVHVERLVALVLQPNRLVEHQTIRADALVRQPVDALVVLVALDAVAVLAVLIVRARVLAAGGVWWDGKIV